MSLERVVLSFEGEFWVGEKVGGRDIFGRFSPPQNSLISKCYRLL